MIDSDGSQLGIISVKDALAIAAEKNLDIVEIAPTATPNADANAQVLYYNSNGGKYYHSMPNCPAVDERYWPLDKFYYSDLNTAKFKNLLRCTKCNAPERP